MKTNNYVTIAVLLILTIGNSACRKTNSAKFVEKWEVTEFRQVETEPYMDYGSFTEVIEMTNGLLTVTGTYEGDSLPSGWEDPGYAGQADLISHQFRIRRNGEWERILVYSMNDTNYTDITNYTWTETHSGSWSFLGNVDQFEKNERVVFNTTSVISDFKAEQYENNAVSDTDSVSTSAKYEDGENPMVFRILESRYGYLELEEERQQYESTSENGSYYTYQTSGLTSYKLEKD